jgi:hypothetical protein
LPYQLPNLWPTIQIQIVIATSKNFSKRSSFWSLVFKFRCPATTCVIFRLPALSRIVELRCPLRYQRSQLSRTEVSAYIDGQARNMAQKCSLDRSDCINLILSVALDGIVEDAKFTRQNSRRRITFCNRTRCLVVIAA